MKLSEFVFDYHCSFIMLCRRLQCLEQAIRWLILEESKGCVISHSMDYNDLLLLIKHMYRWPPVCWFHKLWVNQLGCFFKDVALFFNCVSSITVFDNLLVSLFSQIEHNLIWNPFWPLLVFRCCFLQMEWDLEDMPIVFFSAYPKVFMYFINICHFNSC